MDIGAWLRELGLEQYEAAFRANGVDAEVLPTLTGEELKDIGVSFIRHRRRLLEAIAVLRGESMPPADPRQTSGSQVSTSAAIDSAAGSTAERRQVCVMFCDLVGFTTLSARLDPEDLGAVIRGYQARVAETIRRFGGFIARYVGDGILIYFGWPEAHEANTERAVRSALAVVEAMAQSPVWSEPLQVRIGIATGLVVVGEPIGLGEARQQTAIGETPSLAARLQGLAEPNGVVIDAETRRQIGGLFTCRDLGPVTLKGLPEAVHAWQVIEQAEVESRFEALHAGLMAPLIGRDEELDLLLRRWRQAKAGEGQLILLCGEPGIGKSRLIAALEERLQGETQENLRYFCSPHHQDSALYPIITRWERDLTFIRNDTSQERFDKLETMLSRVGTSPEDIALIADFLSLPAADRYPALAYSAQRKKEETFTALIRQLTNRARRQPVLMLFEDAHWADASSLELLDQVVGLLTHLPVLLVISFRPEFQPPWIGLAVATSVTLRRLTQQQSAQLVARTVVEQSLSPQLLERIVTQTDGVPLFIEELTKAVLEDAGHRGSQAASMTVPTTLQASLVARFDRLPVAKQVAQIGAVIGREFGHALLAAVAMIPEAQLSHGLETLVASGLAFRRGTPPDAIYTFKHALVRDTAYSTLLRSQRQELHARIGRVLQEKFPDIAGSQPELLAHHLTQAGLTDRAIEWWRRAGLRSVARSAHAEATAHFECALDLLTKLPANEQRDARELDLTLDLAVPLIAVHGFGAREVEQCALKAKDLSDKLQGGPTRFAARRLAWNSCLMRQPVPKTVALARNLIQQADEDRTPAQLAVAHRALGYSLLVAGELRTANETLARGAALADAIPDREFAVYGEHPSMVCRVYGGQAGILIGHVTSGAQLVEDAVAHARRSGNVHSLAWATGAAAHVFQIQQEPTATLRLASEAIDVARNHHLPQWLALSEQSMGWAMHQLGNLDAGMNIMMQGVKRWKDIGAMLHTTHCEIMLAEAFLQQGQTVLARAHLDAARAHQASYGENYLAAEIDRLEGLLRHHKQDAIEVIEGYFTGSLNTARRQGARLLELRTATTFARVLAERNERRRAVDLLAPIYSVFTEGFDTVNVKDAKALLDELA